MPFEIGFCGTNKTGGEKAIAAGIARAVEAQRARHDPDAETVTLESGEAIYLGVDPTARQLLIIAETMSPDLSRFTYALADQTASIIQAPGLVAATATAGDPPALMTMLFDPWRMDHEDWLLPELEKAFDIDSAQDEEVAEREAALTERQAAFDKALAERRAALAAGTPARPTPLVQSRSSLFQRLSDALFGKSI